MTALTSNTLWRKLFGSRTVSGPKTINTASVGDVVRLKSGVVISVDTRLEFRSRTENSVEVAGTWIENGDPKRITVAWSDLGAGPRWLSKQDDGVLYLFDEQPKMLAGWGTTEPFLLSLFEEEDVRRNYYFTDSTGSRWTLLYAWKSTRIDDDAPTGEPRKKQLLYWRFVSNGERLFDGLRSMTEILEFRRIPGESFLGRRGWVIPNDYVEVQPANA